MIMLNNPPQGLNIQTQNIQIQPSQAQLKRYSFAKNRNILQKSKFWLKIESLAKKMQL